MKTTQHPNNTRHTETAPTASLEVVNDFLQLSEQQEVIVEHQTISSFLRRIPHRWDIDEITRFGAKMGKVADALQIAYVTTIDRSLGVIRVFPLPLLQRVYTVMALQCGWPKIQAAAMLDAERKDSLRKAERAERTLQEITERAENVDVLHSVHAVRKFLQSDMVRLRKEIGEAEAGSHLG